ncbi:MAG TPA: ABC transporter permease [Anaerovoracaceae bacterium]|nr:ABC transporter permease [Anaerovoracaceae bacterium]
MKRVAKITYIVLVILFLYLPIIALVVLSFNESKSMSVFTGFSLKWYEEMFSNRMIIKAIGNTFTIAITASITATIIGTLAAVGLGGMKAKQQNLLLGFNNVPLLNADIVTGISLLLTFLFFGISLNWGTVYLAHVTFCIPYVILSVRPRINKSSTLLYEAALDLGASKKYAFYKIVLPELRPGIVSGFLLAFTMSVDDFVITHFTRGAGINTISTLIYSQVKVGIRPSLFALSTIIFIMVLLVLIGVNILTDNKRKKLIY